MAKFDFNNHNDLEKLRNELDIILESRIEKVKLDSELNTLGNGTFGAIKAVFEGITDKLFESSAGKKVIARYVKAIREGKNVSDAYSIYEFVYHAPNVTNPELFLNEAVGMTDNFNVRRYGEEKKKVAEIVKEAVQLAGCNSKYVENAINENAVLNEAIEFLICNKKNFDNLDEYVNDFDIVKTHLEENMRSKPVSEGKTGKELISELNEALEGLKDFEKNAIRDISIAKLSQSDLSELFEEYKSSCIEKLDEKIEDDITVEAKSRLETMRKQLEEKKYKQESIYEDIVTLAELKATLNE